MYFLFGRRENVSFFEKKNISTHKQEDEILSNNSIKN